MSEENKVPAAPDYAPFLQAFTAIADSAKQNGADSLAWAKEQVASNKDLLDQVNKGLLDTQSSFGDAAGRRLGQADDLIGSGIQNLKDQYAKYTDPAMKASAMGAAGAEAAQATEAARKASMSELESYGINPGAVRFGGLDAAMRLQSAATRVGAENIAGRQNDALADQTNQQIINEGNVLAGQANQNAGTSGAAGTGAVGGANTTTSTSGGVLGTGLQWTGAGTNALSASASGQNANYTSQLKANELEQSKDSGIGSLLGLGASMLGKGGGLGAGGAFSAGGALAFLEDGGEVPGAPGGAIPMEASPSNGQVTDDVAGSSPGGAIRLNGGEFVIPKDVVSWEGEKSLQNLILKARKAKGEAQAKPRTQAPGGPDPASPAFQPRPQASGGALPV
jgi:hypothetical protein